MGLKFLRISKTKFGIFMGLLIASGICLFLGSGNMAIPSGAFGGHYCHFGLPTPLILTFSILSYILNPIWVLFYGTGGIKTCNLLPIFVGNIIYLFVLSCLITYGYDKFNSYKKQKICGWSIFSIVASFMILLGVLNLQNIKGEILNNIMLVPPLFSVSAIIFGIVALIKIHKNPQMGGKWLALIGIILGLLFILISISYIVIQVL